MTSGTPITTTDQCDVEKPSRVPDVVFCGCKDEAVNALLRAYPRGLGSEEAYLKRCECIRYTAPESQKGRQTLFVNASIEGAEMEAQQLPWLVKLKLPSNKK